MAQVIDMVINQYVTYLTDKLKTDIAPDDPTYVHLVRGGRLQDDPTDTENINYVLLHPNDIIEESWRHQPTLAESNHPFGISGPGNTNPLPPFEIGGGETMWWRRFSVEIGCFFVNLGYDRDVAREIAHRVFGRTEYYIAKVNVDSDAGILGIKDEFNEIVQQVILSSARYSEGGGPPNEFIWRGRLHFDVLTTRSFD